MSTNSQILLVVITAQIQDYPPTKTKGELPVALPVPPKLRLLALIGNCLHFWFRSEQVLDPQQEKFHAVPSQLLVSTYLAWRPWVGQPWENSGLFYIIQLYLLCN